MNESIRKSRWAWILPLVAVVALVGAACGGDDDDDDDGGAVRGFTDAGYKTAGLDKTREVVIDGAIKIGISSALSGDVKGLGVPIADSAELAADGITIKGHKVEIVREDDLCTPEGGPSAADRLIKAKVVAVVGPICSGGTRASLAAYDKEGITHISPSATAGDLTTPQRTEGPFVTFFRVPVLNADEAEAQAKFIIDELKKKKAFVVFDTDDYGKDLAASFQKFFKDEGGEIVGTPAGYEKKATDFKSIIASIKQSGADVVYMAGFYAEATPFLQQLRQDNDTKGIPFMGGDGIKNDELLKAGAAAEGAYLALPGVQGAGFKAYADKYKAKYSGDAATATFGAEAFDAMTILIKAIEKVAKDDGGKLKIDLKALNEEVKEFKLEGGASGDVEFKSDGNRAGAVVRLFQIKGGKYEQLEAD